jgi:hypothetical protein
MPLVDVLSVHPFYSESPEFESEYYYGYPELFKKIKDTAFSNGFKGTFEADELGYFTKEDFPPDMHGRLPVYSETVASKYLARTILLNLSLDCRISCLQKISRPLQSGVIRNMCTIMSKAVPDDYSVSVECNAKPVKSCSFKNSAGEKLIAVWFDGVAAENDPGRKCSIVLPDISSGSITCIDPLYGFEQQLVISGKEGNTLIEGFKLKDYPLIIRISR